MNLIDGLLRTYFHENVDQFGEDAVFEGFEPTGSACADQPFCAVSGAIVYSRRSVRRASKPLLVKYCDAPAQSSSGHDPLSGFAVEMAFYRQVLPAFNSLRSARHLVPELRAAGATTCASGDLTAVVLEQPDGFAEFGCGSFLDYAHLSLMARRIGEFHAYSMAAGRANPEYLAQWRCSATAFERYHRVVPLLERCLQPLQLEAKYQCAGDGRYADGVRRLRLMVEQFGQRLHRPLSAGGRRDCWVLCHRNYSQANVLYRYASGLPVDLRICNWQWMGFASLGVDLVILLFVEANEETRRRCFDRLLADYQEALGGAFGAVPAPSVERILEEVKVSVPVALYALACRVLAQTAESKSRAPLWTEERITDSLRSLISTDFV